MAGFGYREAAVRVKVKKCEPNAPPEWRKFSVDPQITSLEVLYSILAKAFDLKSDFGISYKTLDPCRVETYLPVLSDWDLDAAFLRAHNYSIQTSSEPCLNLRIDIKPFSEAIEWEVNSQATKEITPLQQSIGVGQKYVQNMQNKLPGLIMNQMEKTFSMVQRALNLTDEQTPAHPPRPPLSDGEFRSFLDSVGQILQPNELRKVIFAGGIDPSLRKVVWKHILNVYPTGMTGRERMDYMKRKAAEYYRLREIWRAAVQRGHVVGELAYVTSMVRKDVLRTDRLHPFYAGSDDNQNIASLFNILTTFALNHPSVSYCQGMSDIASPLLVTMGDEAHAYICFCAIMSRLKANFMLDGIAMTQKFAHLSEALQFYDPEFYEYLKVQQADDLLFCYRWLLLEMKREFAFEDSLRMLEVLWSSLQSDPPSKELTLLEKEFEPPPPDVPAPKSPSLVILRTPRENPYTKVCALRRQSSSVSLHSGSPNQSVFVYPNKLDATKRMNQSLDENISRIPEIRKTRSVTKAHQSLDESKMLLLMENMNVCNIINKEEVKQEPEPETRIKFHPTNPFIDEANAESFDVEAMEEVDEVTLDTVSNNNNVETITRTAESTTSVSPKKDLSKVNLGKHQKNSMKMANKNIFAYGTGNIISKQLCNKKGGHFKDLKEKIAAGKKGILASLDKVDIQGDTTISTSHCIAQQQSFDDLSKRTKQQKVVKNFNEFLNFASINKSRISDKLVTGNKIHSTILDKKELKDHSKTQRPLIKLTKNSFDESESSSLEGGGTKPLQLHLTNIVAQSQMSLDGSSPDDSQDYYPMTTSMTRELRLELENLDRQVFGEPGINEKNKILDDDEIGYEKLGKESLDLVDVQAEEIVTCPDVSELIVLRNNERLKNSDPSKRISTCSANTDIFVWENPLHQISGTSSCNFNEIAPSAENEEEIAIEECSNGKREENSPTNAMTPDEQLELEYDGDIVIECSDNDTRKSVTPLRLIQQKNSSTKLRDESDSDNTDNTEPLNPFLSSQFQSQELIETTFVTPHQPTLQQVTDPVVTLIHNPQLGEEAAEANIITSFSKTNNNLPKPSEFGGGNPFLMFLCLTLLLQHRHFVMKSAMDYNEMAMHFDKMVRKHDVTRVLNQARRMYGDYLKAQSALTSCAEGPAKS